MKSSLLLVASASALFLLGGCGTTNQPASTGSTSASGMQSMASAQTSSTVRAAQESLTARGYNVGSVDGVWGPLTQDAILRFQKHRGLAETGQLDQATLAALGVSS